MRINFRSRNVLLTISALVFGIGAFSFWQHYETPDEVPKEMEILMRNLTWNTNLEPFTPYKKNDELEFVFIAESNDSDRASVDISKLEESILVTEILANDIPVSPSQLGGIRFDAALKITVRGKAKDAMLVKEKLRGLLAITFQKFESITKAPIQTKSPVVNIPTAVTVSNTTGPTGGTYGSGSGGGGSRNGGTGSGSTTGSASPAPAETAAIGTPGWILSSNIDQIIPLDGVNLDSIDRVIVGEKSFAGVFQNGKYFFTIPKNTFGNGEYFLGLYLKNGQLVPTDDKLTFTFNGNPINIAAITPSVIKNDQDRYVVVQGNGFRKMISIQLSNNLIFKNALFTIINDNVVSIKIPKWLPAGPYYFNIMDTAGIYEAKSVSFTVAP